MEQHEVIVVGGGPAGAATAIGLARRGRDVVLLERSAAWHWRACGVFTSPATVSALRRLGLTPTELEAIARPIPAMRVETPAGVRFRLTYGDTGSAGSTAVGLDRARLDPLLLDRATAAGVDVRRGASVRGMHRDVVKVVDGEALQAGVIVGADGLRSIVARDAGVVRPPSLGNRVALTFHVAEPSSEARASADGARTGLTRDARMIAFRGGYVGLAPVPGGRVNVGIVLDSAAWRRRLRDEGPDAVTRKVMTAIPSAADDPVTWQSPLLCDRPEGAAPVGARVARRAGRDWLLVGDAAGFLDPFTGEGLHRALRSAELAVVAIDRRIQGDSTALAAYDRAMARRWRGKDVVSLLVQRFLGSPPAFEYAARRLAARGDVRETMGRVMGDLAPASTGLDPRFLVALLRP